MSGLATPTLEIWTPEKELFLVDYDEYHRNPVKPRGFKEFCDMYDSKERGVAGLWEMVQRDSKTGHPRVRVWSNRVITDQGALNILQCAIINAFPSSPFNNILITNNDGSTTLTSALTANATGVTSLSVAAVPAAIPSGTQLQLGYGTSNTQTVTTNGSTAQGATSITVNSFTVNATGFTVGNAVVPIPQVTDNPNNAGLTSNASSPLSQYSGNLGSGAFSGAATTGAGNRYQQVVFVFKNSTNGGSTANGNYTSSWLVNVSSAAGVNNYADHLINTPMRCDNNNNVTATATIKL